MIDYDCPICGKRMIKANIKKSQAGFTLEGLPEDEERLMEVVEYWDSGYSLTPMSLNVWVCEDCEVRKGAKFSNFVMFKGNFAYGYTGSQWQEIVEKVEFT